MFITTLKSVGESGKGDGLMISYTRLWKLLEKRGYTRKDIIRLAGISESTYRKLLAGDTVRMDVLERLCRALHVDIGDVCSFRE